MNEMDWNEVNRAANNAMTATHPAGSTASEKSIFMRMKAGFHHLRLVPAGNPLKRTYFLQIMQHPVKIPRDDGSGWQDKFVLCWSHMMNDLKQYAGNVEEQNTKTFISFLGSQKLLTKDEFTKYNTYGCPFCKVFNHLNQMGIETETKNKFYPKEQWFFNVIHRSQTFNGLPASGDDGVYIWRMAKTAGNKINKTITTMRDQAGVNYLDINTGRDLLVEATGEGLARRYPVVQFVDANTPLNLGEKIPHNLLDILTSSFFEYQKVVNFIKATYGELLRTNNYLIPGDQALTQAYGNSIQTIDMVNQHITQQQTPSQVISPVPTTVATPTPEFDPSFQSGDVIENRDGKLFNTRTGKFLF